jgi:hypothetical protein
VLRAALTKHNWFHNGSPLPPLFNVVGQVRDSQNLVEATFKTNLVCRVVNTAHPCVVISTACVCQHEHGVNVAAQLLHKIASRSQTCIPGAVEELRPNLTIQSLFITGDNYSRSCSGKCVSLMFACCRYVKILWGVRGISRECVTAKT